MAKRPPNDDADWSERELNTLKAHGVVVNESGL